MISRKQLLGTAAALFVLVGCGSGEKPADGGAPTGDGKSAATSSLSGTVNIDGSTTVYPIAQIMGEDFGTANPNVKVSVNKAGTGSGFQKFTRGEIDIVTASRPIEDKEDAEAKKAGLEYIEIPIALDGVTVIVNPANAVKDLSVADLKKMWDEGSTVTKWSDVNPAWPAKEINFHGPTDNHGTYEYFTQAINGKKNRIRKAYQPDQEYTSVIQAVAGNADAIGYVGFNYFEENQDKVKAVSVGGVAPTSATILDGTYVPLSRPLFLYVSKKAFARPEVKAFVDYALGEGLGAVEEAKYVKLNQSLYDGIKDAVKEGKAGSMFLGKPNAKLTDVLAAEVP